MATAQEQQQDTDDTQKLYRSYLGVSFAVLASFLPTLRKAEEELTELRRRRKEDSKANARVVEIFATHRNSWRQEERRLLRRVDDSNDQISLLTSRLSQLESEVEELRRQLVERDELLNFMSRHTAPRDEESDDCGGDDDGGGGGGVNLVFGNVNVGHHDYIHAFDGSSFMPPASQFWTDIPNLWQDVQCEREEPMTHAKHYVVRRESPWKVDGESIGVPSKLKILEEELLTLEKVGKRSSGKVVSLMRKQSKRYQDLAGKIDDLCKRMQASDPGEPTLSSEFRSQRQTEFLLEAFQLQQRASETGKKLSSLQSEVYSNCIGDEVEAETRLVIRRSLDSIRINFKEIQRNLEVWLARIMGDLEGIRARDGASRARDYYYPEYPFVNSY